MSCGSRDAYKLALAPLLGAVAMKHGHTTGRNAIIKMKPATKSLLLCAALALSFDAVAQDTSIEGGKLLTAICRSPAGTTLVSGSKLISEPDGFKDGLFTYSWRLGTSSATIVSQSGSAAGSVPSTEQATAIQSAGFVTFFVMYDRAMWAHSLFIDSKTVLISRHVNSTSAGAPLGGLYTASCSIAAQ